MELGLTTFAEINDPSLTAGGRLREVVEEAKLADDVGLDVYGIGEHHRPDMAVSAPEIVLATIAGVTEQIKLSSAVTVLSSADPVRVPELRHAGSALRRQGGADGRPRLVHRVLPTLRLLAERLRRTLRRETRSAARPQPERAGDVVRQVPRALGQHHGLPAFRGPAAANLDRSGRHAELGGSGRHTGLADGPGHHRRSAGGLCPTCRSVPAGTRVRRAGPRHAA